MALAKQLRDACVGHPKSQIPWPHRVLHEAADLIEQQQADVDALREVLADVEARLADQIANSDDLTGTQDQFHAVICKSIRKALKDTDHD